MERIMLGLAREKESSGLVAIQTTMPSVFVEIEELMSGKKKNAGYMSKLIDLDGILRGFQSGTLNIIVVRPSIGKTALALNIAQFGVARKRQVTYFSLVLKCRQSSWFTECCRRRQ